MKKADGPMSISAAGVSFPVALVLLAGWLAMLAVQNGNNEEAWFFFIVALGLAVVFQSVWLYQSRRSS
jgi:hypothetical protein